MRWLVVDGDTPFRMGCCSISRRNRSCLRQNLVQLGRFDLRLQLPFDRQGLSISPSSQSVRMAISELIPTESDLVPERAWRVLGDVRVTDTSAVPETVSSWVSDMLCDRLGNSCLID